MSNVALHPTAARLAPPPRPIDSWRASPHVYTFGEICHQFGLLEKLASGRYEYSIGRRIDYLRAAHEQLGFPAPHPKMSGTILIAGAAAIDGRARWDKRAVDAWFDGQLPPGAAEHATSAARSRDEQALDDNAAALAPAGRRARG